MPVVSSALTHTKPTGYDRAGNCRPKLSPTEISKRYILAQQCRLAEYQHMKAGQKVGCVRSIELRWNAFLGFRDYGEKELEKARKLGKKLGVELETVSVAPNEPGATPKAEAHAAKADGKGEGQGAAADAMLAPPPTAAPAVREDMVTPPASSPPAEAKLTRGRPFNLARWVHAWAADAAEPLKEPQQLGRLCPAAPQLRLCGPGAAGFDAPDKGSEEKASGKKPASTEMV